MKNDNRILAAFAAVAGLAVTLGFFYYSEHKTEIQEGSVYAVAGLLSAVGIVAAMILLTVSRLKKQKK